MVLMNYAKDHRLRALIPTGIASKFSISDNQFGIIQRGVIDSAMEVWEKEGWDERPDSIYPMLSFVGLSDDKHGVSVLTNSTREYEIVGENFDTIAITLFRSIGVLGKEELVRRPGRPSGIKLLTPDSQMLGKIELEFAITTHASSTSKANVARIAKEYLTPIEVYNKIPYDAMKLNPSEVKTPAAYSFLQEVSPNAVLSTLKKAEKESQYVLRFYNPTMDEKKASYQFAYQVGHVYEANLNEKVQRELEVQENVVEVAVKKNQVKTIVFLTSDKGR
jgi:mannosylglycerate hydrolase